MRVSPAVSSLRDSLLLLLWGIFILRLGWSGQLAGYLHPSLQPYTVAAGAALSLLSLLIFRGFLMIPKAAHDCCHDHGCAGDHHDHGEIRLGAFSFRTILLLLPLGIILSGEGINFTMVTVQNRGVVDDLAKLPSANSAASMAEAPSARNSAAGVMPLQIIDMLYALQMPSYREEFEGRQVELIGQFVPMTTGNPKGDRFQAIRMFITCCAADAKPVGVTVQYQRPLRIPEMGWVKIIGKPTFPMEGGRRTAVLEATTVEPCTAPAEPFVY